MAPKQGEGVVNEGYELDDHESNVLRDESITPKSSDRKRGKIKEEEINKQDTEDPPPVSFFSLFRFASSWDIFLIIVGVISSASTGLAFPALIILYGYVTQGFVDDGMGGSESSLPCSNNDTSGFATSVSPSGTSGPSGPPDLLTSLEDFAIGVSVIGIANMLLGYLFVTCFNAAAENQVNRIRCLFFQAVLKQNIGWYDVTSTNDFASKITEDLNKVQEGIGEKIGLLTFALSGLVSNLISAFVYGWELTLVLAAPTPVLLIAMGYLGKVTTNLAEEESSAYGKAGAVAEEVISAIRTVVAFGGAKKEVERYDKTLVYAQKAGIKRGLATGISMGTAIFFFFGGYALAFWYGGKLIFDGLLNCIVTYNAADLIVVFCNVLGISMNINQIPPPLESVATARGSAAAIYHIIDRKPPIDSSSEKGDRPKEFTGKVVFENVRFAYPSRPDVKVLQGLNVEIEPGQTVALVGSSGCGKSTSVQLIQRFYDPVEGRVTIDGTDIRDLHLEWLRGNIGVVSQEPVLFGTTIKENIRYGRQEADDSAVIEAAKEANAHGFIMKLPKGYDTLVGERGTQLSGGQKQRLAIARALVRNPKLLLLDEATSALDNQSEATVQKALDKARKGRTTIIVAHRLSTIRNADVILVLHQGVLQEKGTHEELMKLNNLYAALVKAQQAPEQQDQAPVDGPDIDEDEEDKNKGNLDVPASRKSSVKSEKLPDLKSTDHTVHQDPQEEEEKQVSLMRLLKANTPEWFYIAVGVVSASISGTANVAIAILYGEAVGSLSYTDIETARAETYMYALLFMIVGTCAAIATFLQAYMFAIAGERLTSRIRLWTFSAMLKQEIGWYDRQENNVGSLCARLAGDASSIQGATGSRLGTIAQFVLTVTVALGFSLYYDYRLGLVTACFVPPVFISTFLQAKIMMSQNVLEKKAVEKSAKIAMEGISNIRTVASLSLEKTFLDDYVEALRDAHERTVRRAHVRGLVYGFVQAVPNFAIAVSIYYGGWLVTQDEMIFKDVLKIGEALIYGTVMVGQAIAYAPAYNKARIAAVKIFNLLDRVPKIDTSEDSGSKVSDVQGNVDYCGVKFSYPTRLQVPVLKDLHLSIQEGRTVALVGHSGCGKSTCMQLLQRFYDPLMGEVRLDGRDINPMNVPQLRSYLGIVSQEPTLFNRTLADNIAYGDNSRAVPMDEIIQAARRANIHNFITSLPAGYDTSVGDRGTQLSGGQKQRIAIARALVRAPKILLLDEATSALDSESEKVVQEALDQAREGRTCIVIAHRLSTIQNADCIYVFSEGEVIEKGTHNELLEKKGHYYDLYTSQGGQFLQH